LNKLGVFGSARRRTVPYVTGVQLNSVSVHMVAPDEYLVMPEVDNLLQKKQTNTYSIAQRLSKKD